MLWRIINYISAPVLPARSQAFRGEGRDPGSLLFLFNALPTSTSYFLSLIDAHMPVLLPSAPVRGCFLQTGPYLALIGPALL